MKTLRQKARERWNQKFSYRYLNERHMQRLCLLVDKHLAAHNLNTLDRGGVEMRRTKYTELNFKTNAAGLDSCFIRVYGTYFDDREGISFWPDGLIECAGWASNVNLVPFIDAFSEWMTWLDSDLYETNWDYRHDNNWQ